MILEILYIVLGLAMLVFGANGLVDGSCTIARRFKVSEFVIGLTIVGFGTSCPELVVSLTGAFAGSADIAIGNVAGSNIFNVLLILGITAVIMPVSISKSNTKRDIPITFITTALLIVFALLGSSINRIEGIFALLLFAAYIYFCFKNDKKQSSEQQQVKQGNIYLAILYVALGLAGLIIGGNLIVNNSVALAKQIGISEKVIAITLLAGGTSLPELVTCIVAAAKKKDQLALGNILGSNVFNILLVLGGAAVVTPLSTKSMTIFDWTALFMSGAILLLWSIIKPKDKITKPKGLIMIILYLSYLTLLFIY